MASFVNLRVEEDPEARCPANFSQIIIIILIVLILIIFKMIIVLIIVMIVLIVLIIIIVLLLIIIMISSGCVVGSTWQRIAHWTSLLSVLQQSSSFFH